MRLPLLALPLVLLIAACQGSTGPVIDPNPYADPGEAINAPTDGVENEIEAE